jgi:site-specific DNA-cytosine methylase
VNPIICMDPIAGMKGIYWLAGQYLADGWARRDGRHDEVTLTVGNHEAEQIAWELAARTVLRWARRETDSATQFTCCHRELVRFLYEQFGHLAQHKLLPGWVYGLPSWCQRELLEGYALGDGHRHKDGYVELTTTSRALAFGMKTLLNVMSTTACVYYDDNNRGGMIDGRKIEANFGLWKVRYREQLDEAHQQTFRTFAHEFCPVREVGELSGHAHPVFNISVEEDESYVVEGIVVHNCTHFSKARGSKPKKKEIRGLAWVVVDWARQRQPDVITLENVEEFRQWGPLAADGQPCPRRKGETFNEWKAQLEALGYVVESRELRACDYGAPTTRKRLFVVARCDGKDIIWPEKTHGSGSIHESLDRQAQQRSRMSGAYGTTAAGERGRHRGAPGKDRRDGSDPANRPRNQDGALKPFRTAAECIDWSIPMLSIFATPAEASAWAAAVNVGRSKHDRIGVPRRPLKPKTLQRIARGLVKWVIQAKRPYIVQLAHGGSGTFGDGRENSIDAPLGTVHAGGNNHAVVDVAVAPYTAGVGGRAGQSPATSVEHPMPTVTGKADRVVAAAMLAPFAVPRYGERDGQQPRSMSVDAPMPTIVGTGNEASLVAATLTPTSVGYWRPAKDGDPLGYELYRRHYSAAKNPKPKQRQFVGPGEKLVLLGSDGKALWAWRKFIDDSGQTGVNCAVFRNESGHLSSWLVSEAVGWAWARWPGERLYTYVDAKAIRSRNPGCCFKAAGWRECGTTKKGLIVLEKLPPPSDGQSAAAMVQTLNHGGDEHRAADLREPLATVTGANDARALVAAMLTKHYGGDEGPGTSPAAPFDAVTARDHHALTVAHLLKFRGESPGTSADAPLDTITSGSASRPAGAGHAMGVSVAYLSHFYTSNTAGGHGDPLYPAKCITSGGQHAAVTVAVCRSINQGSANGAANDPELGRVDPIAPERPLPDLRGHEAAGNDDVRQGLPAAAGCHEESPVRQDRPGLRGGDQQRDGGAGRYGAQDPAGDAGPRAAVTSTDRRAIVAAFLQTYYGNSKDGHSPADPMPTVVSKDRIGLVTVTIDDQTYVVTDIAMRMLTPRELLLAQGFPADYRVDVTADGTHVSKADQVKLIGNAVPPPFARALAFANVVQQGVLGRPPRRKAVAHG